MKPYQDYSDKIRSAAEWWSLNIVEKTNEIPVKRSTLSLDNREREKGLRALETAVRDNEYTLAVAGQAALKAEAEVRQIDEQIDALREKIRKTNAVRSKRSEWVVMLSQLRNAELPVEPPDVKYPDLPPKDKTPKGPKSTSNSSVGMWVALALAMVLGVILLTRSE